MARPLDARRPEFSITATTNAPTSVETTWLDDDGVAWPLTGHTVRLWVGGARADGDDFTDALEVVPVVVGNVATFTIPGQAASRALRLSVDGELVSVGSLSVSSAGTASPVQSVAVAVDSAHGALSLTVGPGLNSLPAGGTTGQALVKASDADRDTEWADVEGVGGGVPSSRAISAGTGLTGGGDLSEDRTLSLSSGSISSLGKADSAVQPGAGLAVLDSAAASKLTGIETSADVTDAANVAAAGAHMAATALGGVLSGTLPNPSFAADMATQAELDAHVNDTSDAHDASAISVADSGELLAATDVEGALAEIATDIDNHVSDSSAAHAASAISYAGGSGMSATDVEAALDELATEKQNALRTIGTQSGGTYTLAAGDAGTLLLLTDSTPDLTVPDDGDVTWAVGASVDVIGTAGPVTLIEDTLVTVNVAAGQSLVTEDAGSAFTLVKTAAQTWWAVGRFAAP